MKIKSMIALGLSLSVGFLSTASAEVIPGTTFSVNFESANVVGTGRNINMHRVPVIDINTGQTTLYDVTFRFTFAPSTGFTFEQISSVAISSPVPVTNITPGIYKTQQGLCYQLEGPTMIDANRSLYTFRGVDHETSSECGSKDLFAASIVSGSAAGHPDIGNREIVPNLIDNYVYGFITHRASFAQDIGITWEANELIGLRQSGNQLIIGLFSEGVDNNDSPVDFKDPRETAILTKIIE